MRYLVRRGAYAMFMLLGVSLLSFCLLQAAPGDYFDSLLLNPRVSRETLATLRVRAGTASPVLVRYGHWLASIVRGNWGYSLAYNMPAANILWPRAANTLLLTTISTFLAWLLALLLGTASSTWQGPLPDGIFKALMAASLAVPDVVLALVLLLFAVRSGMFPVGGISTSARSYELSSQVATNFTHLVLPVVCLVTSSLPLLLAHVRSAVSEALQQPFVVAARSYGLRPTRLMLRHVLPAAANPLISLLVRRATEFIVDHRGNFQLARARTAAA